MHAAARPLVPRILFALARSLAAIALVLGACGCASQSALTVADWTLTCDGCTEASVHLPARLGSRVPPRDTSYTLSATVPLAPDLRGRELSLALPAVYTLARLHVGEEDLEPLDASLFDRVRPADAQLVFRIPARLTDRDALPLSLVLERRDTFVSCVVGEAPRLAAASYGDSETRLTRTLNRTLLVATLALGLALAAVYGLMFALDRRRAAVGYFAAFTLGMVFWNATAAGITQVIDPRDFTHFPPIATGILCVTAPGLVSAHFGRGRPPRAVVALLVALALASSAMAWMDNYAWLRLVQAEILLLLGYLVWFFGTAMKERSRRFDASLMVACWVLLATAGIFNPVRQVHVTPPAWIAFILVHAVLLARAQTRSLRRLNAELAERIATLQATNAEVAVLNDELRWQVGDRSARLVETLARVGRLSLHGTPMEPGADLGGRYRVGRKLGEGAMGAVYEVERVRDGKRFAMKTISRARGVTALARLAREAEIATKVVHPNVVGVVDVDVSPTGVLYLVMDLVDGRNLAAETARYGDGAWATGVLRQVAAGLHALHAAGIVHRDLKPANVLLEERAGGVARAKIVDFGVSRIAGGEDDSASRPDREAAGETAPPPSPLAVTPELTRTGIVIGTPLYMAPELATGSKEALPACDVWSFGVMAFQLATGRLPFESPPLLKLRAGRAWTWSPPDTGALPAPLDVVVARCLEERPERRMTAAEIVAAFEAAAPSTSAGPSSG